MHPPAPEPGSITLNRRMGPGPPAAPGAILSLAENRFKDVKEQNGETGTCW